MSTGQMESPFLESLAASENGLEYENLQRRLQLLAGAKSRALDMVDYIKDHHGSKHSNASTAGRRTRYDKLATDIGQCGNYLVFKHYFTRDEVRLTGAKTCHKSLLCPFCARGRAARYAQAYCERMVHVMKENASLVPYLVTVTVKDGDSLSERVQHLMGSLKKLMEARRNCLKGQRYCEASKAIGGVYSTEVKRGSGSSLWHPHTHAVWLCEVPPDAAALSAEWKSITGDSFVVDVRPINGFDGLLEVFKYALKFSDMTLPDNFEAFEVLSRKRLVNSFGCLRGVDLPESVLDAPIDDETLPFILYFYRYTKAGYSFVSQDCAFKRAG